jgi:hypothetical protein
MAILRYAAACALAGLVSGCGDATATIRPAESSVAVHSVLAAGARTAAVMLTRFDPDSPDPEARFSGISGAEVRLVRGSDTLQLREAPAGFRDCFADPFEGGETEPIRPGCYASAVAEGLRAGDRYELRITFADGATARGAVTIPSAPDILAPSAGRVVSVITAQGNVRGSRNVFFPVRWRVPAGVGRIEIAVARPVGFREGRPLAGVECRLQQGPLPEDLVQIDSVTHQVVNAFCRRGSVQVEWDSISAQLVVTAYDTAYARYAREVASAGAVRRNRASAGIEGAFGVFGGAASSERRLVLVPATN